jgi:putative ABC transport system ATP-binding protein
VIEICSIFKTYVSGRGKVTALENISFTVARGKLVVIAGKSGSGKTTLLNCIGGLEKPDCGRITCAGTDVSALSGTAVSYFQRKHFGFVFQFGNLISHLTVNENISFPLELNGISGSARDRRVQELLDRIGLSHIGEALPHELSGGETQRVAFARAIAHSPSILLVDEPTASLDTINGRQLIHLMHQLITEQDCTLVVATHDPEVIEMAADRLHLKDGRKEGFK